VLKLGRWGPSREQKEENKPIWARRGDGKHSAKKDLLARKRGGLSEEKKKYA